MAPTRAHRAPTGYERSTLRLEPSGLFGNKPSTGFVWSVMQCSMPQDLWVGSAAGLKYHRLTVPMYVVCACKCTVPDSLVGVRRPHA